jgi:hypothetical protein
MYVCFAGAKTGQMIDQLLHLYRKEKHGEHSVSCNGNRNYEGLKSDTLRYHKP